VQAAKGIPLYAGPNKTSNCGSGFWDEASASTMVDAYADARVARMGPVLSRPALIKYGEILGDCEGMRSSEGCDEPP